MVTEDVRIARQIARRAFEEHGLERGDAVTVELLGSGGSAGTSATRPRTVTGTAFDATTTVLIVAGYDDAATLYRIPWHAIALISTTNPVPQHPATT